MKDPWAILGIPRTATVEEIKAQYRKLALSLHPDKHEAGLSLEERAAREERFKEVTVAYQVAINVATKSTAHGCDWDQYEDSDKWRSMWERVESMIRNENFMSMLGSVMKDTFKDFAMSHMAPDPKPEDDTPRVFKLPVTLEEVHTKKTRKVRLFLTEFPNDPFFLYVDFDTFPEMVCSHEHMGRTYQVVLEMRPEKHPIYHWDNLLHGWDLYTTVPITLAEYFTGCTRDLPQLGGDGTIPVVIPPFPDAKRSIVVQGMGLRGRGDLYVILEVRLPTDETWKMLDEGVQRGFLDVCKNIENPDAPHGISS